MFIENHQLQVLNVAGNREVRSNGGGDLLITQSARWIVGLSLDLLLKQKKLVLL